MRADLSEKPDHESSPPLRGFRILDLTRLLPGGYATLLLADLGAEIIKVEEPGIGDYIRYLPPTVDGESIYFHLINRNKKSVSLNLKDVRGVQIFKRLAAHADVVIEGFRPGVVARLGVGYDDLASVNPDLVYCSLSGYGQSGPLRDHPGHDLNYQARSGILSLMRTGDSIPILPPVQVSDLAGAMTAVISIIAALLARERGAGGRSIDVSLHESAMHWTIFAQCETQAEGRSPRQGDSILTGRFAFYGVYQAADGRLLSLALPEHRFWTNFCEAIGRQDFVDRFIEEPSQSLRDEIAAIIRTRTADEWLEYFAGRDVCCDPVLDLDELRSDPHSLHRRVFASLPAAEKALWCQLFPAQITGLNPEPSRAPHLGEHNDALLGDLFRHKDELEELRSAGVI